MMRNEHIVRAHQTPIAAVNPVTGLAWNVIHVDNAVATAGGAGTVESPYRSLAQAQAAAALPYDVIFVHTGTSAANPYLATLQFQADNQILVGAGSTLQLATADCGFKQFFNTGASGQFPTTSYPVMTSSSTAITLRNGAIVDHLAIQNAPVGIAGHASLSAGANVNDVAITGSNSLSQVGISMANVPGGQVNFYNMQISKTGTGFWVNGGAGNERFQGAITQTAATGTSVYIENVSGGTITINQTVDSLITPAARNPQTLPLSYSP